MVKAPGWMLGLAGMAAFAGSAIAAADVPAGVAAWQAGDYDRAVAEWRPLADAGNADAQFNLAQAYRLGRGVPQDLSAAEQWFERAARQRHDQAGTNLGLLLFQNGRAREAMPWIQAAALRGDPRAQYVFGTALFNGDIVRRDLPRAYAMMTAAAAQNFPQADAQLREMDRHVPTADRDRGRVLAAEMAGPSGPERMAEVRPAPPPRQAPPRPQMAEVRPPAQRPGAGVSYPPPPEIQHGGPPQVVPPPRRPDRQVEAPALPARGATTGGWRVQLGAFSNEANARRQWQIVNRRVRALAALQPAYTSAGAITRLRAGPLASRAEADQICSAVRAVGQGCIPVIP